MFIKYTNYSDGIHDIRLVKKSNEVGLEKPFWGNVIVECRMDKSASQIILDCEMSVHGKFVCDRCNELFDRELKAHFQLTYLFTKSHAISDEENVFYLSPDVDKLVITNDVRDYGLLSVPMKNLCSPDCKGLCPHCGTNLNYGECSCEKENINPVWEPLLKIKNKLN